MWTDRLVESYNYFNQKYILFYSSQDMTYKEAYFSWDWHILGSVCLAQSNLIVIIKASHVGPVPLCYVQSGFTAGLSVHVPGPVMLSWVL